ncbi:MAG: DUF6249 domain-containing protein [Candidatus Velthaea sp.]
MDDNAVGALAITCIFGLPVAAFIILRVLSHRERIEMIRRGMAPPPGFFGDKRNRDWFAHNAGMQPPPMPPPSAWTAPPSDQDSPDCSLRKGITVALIGLAILIGLSFIGYTPNGGAFNSPTITPGPWLLGGLIPMFVGIAQIIIALLSGARLGAPMPPPRQTYAPPPFTGSEPQPPGYSAEPRVHNGFEELKRPVQPPERL